MNGYYGFVPRHLQHQILPPPVQAPNGLALYTRTTPSQSSGRKREHPDTNEAPENGLVNGTFLCNGTYDSDTGRARSQYADYEKVKRICLKEREVHLEAPPPPSPCVPPGAMDCSSYPKPNDRDTNRQLSGVRLPYMPNDPHEADIIDMNPVTPVAATHTSLLSIKNRRVQLCLMEELCSCAHSMGISVLECPKCLAGEGGHLAHILEDQTMETQ